MPDQEKNNSLVITEIYKSIQGESTWTGCPCVFVRLSGCDLRCGWCDSEYTFSGGDRIAIDKIVEEVENHGCPLVEITGGEPLLQPGVHPLISTLIDRGHRVIVETGGHLDVSVIDPRAIRVIDVKCPGSGESQKVRWKNLDALRETDQIKFVLADRGDYDWAKDIIRRHSLNERVAVLLSVAHGILPPADLAAWILEDRLNVRLQIQLHKYIWSSVETGI